MVSLNPVLNRRPDSTERERPFVKVKLDSQARIRTKLRLLQMHFDSGVGHIGGDLSALDILLVLYHNILTREDAFILSKGHAAGALYVSLWSIGVLNDADLLQFHKDATRLPGHPPASGIPEICFGAGSLGHGLAVASGMALGRRIQNIPGRVFCLTSDGEWNEGSCWESLIFLNHHDLSNLIFIVDLNGLQGFGATREVACLDSLADKFRSFGITTKEVDGHNPDILTTALASPVPGPRAIIAHTCKGQGISFMENRMEWHYLPMSKQQYEQAIREVRGDA